MTFFRRNDEHNVASAETRKGIMVKLAAPSPYPGAFPSGSATRCWLATTGILVIGLALLGAIFQPEITSAYRVWTGSTAFNHCFLVLPVAAYLAWQRREMLASTLPQPSPWIALAALPLAF